MDLITALQVTAPSVAARCNIPPCDAVTEHVPGDASLNRALAIIFEYLLDQTTFTGRLKAIDVAIEAWDRNHELFMDRFQHGEEVRQSIEGWNELIKTLHHWRDAIVDDFLKPVPRSPYAPFATPRLLDIFDPQIGVA